MQKLLKDFNNLTNIKVCIYDNHENELCYYPEKFSPFCAILREDGEMDEKCKNCDRNAFAESKRTHKQYFYTCHAGLLECVSPILFNDKIIGYILVGQIKAPSNPKFSDVANKLPSYLLERLEDAYENLPVIEMDKINSALHIVNACTGYEYLKALVNSYENKIDVLIDGYINEHVADDLSVQILCSRFKLSHSELYSIFKEFFRSTPAEYIKLRRLNKACELLKNTNLPVNKIAEKCGIPDYNYFSKIFKGKFGISPREMRKSLK